MPRLDEMPKVEVHLVQSNDAPGGIGEPGLPPIAPVVTNAIFVITGRRIRRLPNGAEDFKGRNCERLREAVAHGMAK